MDPLRITYAAELLAVALAAAIGGLTGYRASAHYRRVAYGLAVVGLLCFCLLPISARLLPLLYHIPQPVSITTDLIMAIGFLLIGVAYRRSWDRSRGRILVSVLAIVATSFVLGAPLSRLINGPRYATLKGRSGEAHVMQGESTTCAAACATTILRRFGVPATEGEMATRCRTSFFGTSKFGMIRGMREAAAIRGVTLEFQVRIRQSAADLLTLRRPAIITAEVNGAGHAMVLLDISRDGKRLIIGDPLQHALLRITPERLAQHYQFTGDVLIVTRR